MHRIPRSRGGSRMEWGESSMFRPGHVVSRAARAALLVVVVVVVSLSSASAATTVAPLAVPGIAAIRLGGDNYAQTHLPQYETVFLGPRSPRRSELHQAAERGDACAAVERRPIPEQDLRESDAADVYDCGQLQRGAGARPGEPVRSLDPSGRGREPDRIQGLPERGVRESGLGQLSVAGAHESASQPDRFDAALGRGQPRQRRAELLQPGRGYDPRQRAFADLPDERELVPGGEVAVHQRRFLPAPAGLLRRRQRGGLGRYDRRGRRKPGGADLASGFDGYTQEYFEQHGFDGSLAYNGNTSASDFNDRLRFVDIAQALGKDYFGGMHYDGLCATGPACTLYDAMMYGEAAFKLKWDGSGGGYRMHRPAASTPGTPPGRRTSAPRAGRCTRSRPAGGATTPPAP